MKIRRGNPPLLYFTKRYNMQLDKAFFNPERHVQYKALTMKQPFATAFVTESHKIEDGTSYAHKTIAIQKGDTQYRGDIMICSKEYPKFNDMYCGCTQGVVELYDTKPVSEFTDEDWKETIIPKEERKKIKGGYGWIFRNPRPMVEMPVTPKKIIVLNKEDITFYPKVIIYDE